MLGSGNDGASDARGRRLADPIWDDVAASPLLSQSSGGWLAGTLEHLAASVPSEVQLRKAIVAQNAATVRATHITLVVPIAVVFFLRLSLLASPSSMQRRAIAAGVR